MTAEGATRADPAVLLRELTACLSRRDRAGANRVLASLTRSAPLLRQQWRSLAALAMNHGEIDLALAAAWLLVRDMGNAAAARYDQAVLLARVGRLDEATAILGAIGPSSGPNAPDRATLDFTRATIALDRGDLALARSLLDDVVMARPLAGPAWLARTTAGDMTPAQEDRLLALHDRAFATVPAAERAPALYAAGQVLHRRGAHDRAFAHFAAGAAVRRQSLRHDRAADAASAAVATHGTTRARPASNQGRAIFVVGLPRSGTTLVEQILTAHSHVAGGGELNLMRLVAQDAGGPNAAAVEAYEARGGSRADLSALYHHLLDQRFGPEGRIVDKTLNGSRLLGLIDAVMPDSPIIWVRRDPLDCAWSCLRTHFALGAAWSLDQRDMGEHMKLEDQLFARWCDLLGERILPVDYAALVDDPAAQIGRILEHCGLPEEPAPYAPEENARAVTTSSVVQVRRPINSSGIGTAIPYEAHLKSFVTAYNER